MDRLSKESSNMEEEDHMLLNGRPKQLQRTSDRRLLTVLATITLLSVLLVPVSFYVGLQKGRAVLPKLPTDPITKGAIHMELTDLDDEFEVSLAENKRFKGLPRPELDQAWVDILKGINIRVPRDVAAESNFTSIELNDGSGDMLATPAVFHHLHCLKSIRQSMFPEQYPANWEIVKPLENGALGTHMDHCIENLRQAIMCQGDMSLYHYFWHDWTSRPGLSMKSPHVCANFDKLQQWAIDHSFSLYDGKLTHPKFGILDPLHFAGSEQAPEGHDEHGGH